MTTDWEYDWEYDWENIDMTDLIGSLQDTIKRERELEERKLIEEADLVLIEDLFDKYKSVKDLEQVKLIKIEKNTELNIKQKKKYEQQERQKEKFKKKKNKNKKD